MAETERVVGLLELLEDPKRLRLQSNLLPQYYSLERYIEEFEHVELNDRRQ